MPIPLLSSVCKNWRNFLLVSDYVLTKLASLPFGGSVSPRHAREAMSLPEEVVEIEFDKSDGPLMPLASILKAALNHFERASAYAAHRRSQESGRELLQACSRRDGEQVLRLLNQRVSPNFQDHNGWSALHWASGKGDSRVVEQLLEAKADVNLKDEDGGIALHVASMLGDCRVVEQLLEANADVSHEHNDGGSPLLLASEKGHSRVVEQLLEANANVNQQHKQHEKSALHAASAEGQSRVVEQLLEANADVNLQDAPGMSAADVAIWFKRGEAIEVLRRAAAPTFLVEYPPVGGPYNHDTCGNKKKP